MIVFHFGNRDRICILYENNSYYILIFGLCNMCAAVLAGNRADALLATADSPWDSTGATYPGDVANKMSADTPALLRVGRERYAKLLHTYPAMLVCGSIFNYLVAKVFEGMAAGCLTVCERNSLGRQLSALGFLEGVHYIATDLPTVIEDVNEVRNAYLCDIAHWQSITRAATVKVSKEHTTAVRAIQIHSICMESEKI